MKNERWFRSSQGYSRVVRDSRISSLLRKWFMDRSEVSSMVEDREGILEFEIINMVLVVSKEEAEGWISSRTVTSY